MAVMIVSGSMPFSLARASIVCISGFCIFSEFHFQPAARNEAQRQAVHPVVGGLEQHRVVLDPTQAPFERLLVVHGLAHNDLCQAARETSIVVDMPQWPVESR